MNTSNETLNGSTKGTKDLKRNTEGKFMEYGADLNKLSEEAGKRVGEVAAQVKTAADEYMASGRKYIERGQEYVKTNPEKSLAMALGVGAVIGGLLVYAMRRKS